MSENYTYAYGGQTVPPEDIQRFRWWQGIANPANDSASVLRYLQTQAIEYAVQVKRYTVYYPNESARIYAEGRLEAYRDALRVLTDAIDQIETPRVYRVEVTATVEAWTEDHARHTAGTLLARAPLSGPGSWAPDYVGVTEVRS